MKNALKWIAGAAFIFAMISALILRQYAAAVLFFAAALICIPPTLLQIESLIRFKLSPILKLFSILILMLTGSVMMKPDLPVDRTIKTENSHPVSTSSIAPESKPELSIADEISRELDFLDTFKSKPYVDIIELHSALFLFTALQVKINKAKDQDAATRQLADQLQEKTAKLQILEFPKIRAAFAESLRKSLWENDIDVAIAGAAKTTLRLTGGTFAANRNIKTIQEKLNESLIQFRFKRTEYRWYRDAEEFTYFTMPVPEDSAPIE